MKQVTIFEKIEVIKQAKQSDFFSQDTVKLDFKELLNKEQIDFRKLFTDHQLFCTIYVLLNKELLPI